VRTGFFSRSEKVLRAVDGVSIRVRRGETVGLVGESGCGKSSLSRAVLRLEDIAAGAIHFQPTDAEVPVDIARLPQSRLRPLRRQMQIVFQDPQASLNPRLRIGSILDESLRALEPLDAASRRERAREILAAVGLAPEAAGRFAHEFSGGQRQRIAIARALISKPSFVVLDEPVSALDVSVRAQILNLLVELQKARGLTYLFVSHDLSVVRYLCDDIGVMYLGKLVETGPAEAVFAKPLHPYTRQLLAALPVPDPRARRPSVTLQGDPPNPMDVPVGCAFYGRCDLATDQCRTVRPDLSDVGKGRRVSCHHATIG
jgi:oligopeptide/dipeptide ABC transporter ATP-binding protein